MQTSILCRIPLTFVLCFLLGGIAPSRAAQQEAETGPELQALLASECINLDKAKLESLLVERFGDALSPERSPDLWRITAGVIERADFDSISEEKAVEVIGLVSNAYGKGASLEFLDDIYDVAYATPMTADQLAAAANALQDFHRSDVPRDIYEEFVFHAIEDRWDPAVLPVLTRGLIYGVDRGLSPDKVALIIMLDMKNGERRDKGPQQLVLDAIKLVREKEPKKWRPMTRRDRDAAQKRKRNAALVLSRETIDRELEERERAFLQARRELAELREQPVAQRPGDAGQHSRDLELLISKLQGEIAQYQARRGAVAVELEAIRKAIDRQQKTKDRERRQRRQQELDRASKQVASQGKRGRLDRDRLLVTVNQYLGTPYRFGGDSAYGMDCSAFTRRVYRGQGIELPRNSREQARVGRAVSFSDLRTGDLIFFDISISGRISHVGVYLGNGIFAHASSSRGVTKSNVRERYYAKRFVRGVRIFND